MRTWRSSLVPLACLAIVLPLAARITPPSPTPAPTATEAAATPDASCPAIPLAAADAAAPTTASSPDAWGGPRKADAPTLSDRVVKYTIDATLDPVKHTVTGRQQLTWRNRSSQPVCSIYLHLYLNGFESNGSTFFSERNRGFKFRSEVATGDNDWGYIRLDSIKQGEQVARWSYVHPDNGPETDHTVVRVDLPQPIAAGASSTFDIDFFDQLPRVVARTGYFDTFHLVGQWFPKIGVLELPGERGATTTRWNAHEFHMNSEFYADFGSFDVTLHVPKGYTVGATGELQGTPAESGNLVSYRYTQDDVHDFAWTADNKTATPLEATWTHPGSPPVKVRVLVPNEYAMDAQPVLKATLDSLTYFSDTLGPYPYRTVTAVVPPHNADEAGGMEYPTFFTADHAKDFSPGTTGQYLIDFVTIHEFGHGYFYGILASNEFEEPALDEGVNQYWDDRMLSDRHQALSLASSFSKRFGLTAVMPLRTLERLSAGLSDPKDPVGENSWDRLPGSYNTVYSRTATMLNDIEAQIGHEAMGRAMKFYYERWKFRHPTLTDFRDALAEGSGRPDVVNRSFDIAVFNARKIDDRVASIDVREMTPGNGYRLVDGKRTVMTQAAVDKSIDDARAAWKKQHPDAKSGGPYPFESTVVVRRDGAAVPQQLKVTFDDGSVKMVNLDGDQRWFRYQWSGPAKAVKAELDPQGLHGMDVSQIDNGRTVEPHRMSLATRAMGWLQLAIAQGQLL
ncbi:MAG: M1 family metallopeptidase [Proteobacteria bacterium]|nr:M1 family metallopeptidase [Pseudomonadota bacterium]MBS0217280.1 M1 family metallopeptidase [Pseudomonadota bacterium]